jgi:hypothetical protein
MSLLNSAEEHGLYLDAEHQLGHFECSGDLVNFVYSREKKKTLQFQCTEFIGMGQGMPEGRQRGEEVLHNSNK